MRPITTFLVCVVATSVPMLSAQNVIQIPPCPPFGRAIDFERKGELQVAKEAYAQAAQCSDPEVSSDAALRLRRLEIGPLNLIRPEQVNQALAVLRTIEQQFPNSRAHVDALILQEGLKLQLDHSAANLNRVLDALGRLGVDSVGGNVAEAAYYSGLARHLLREHDVAIHQFSWAAARSPDPVLTARALLGLARSNVALSRDEEAMRALQRIRGLASIAPAEAAVGLRWSTILSRLYLPVAAGPYPSASLLGNRRDLAESAVRGMTWDGGGNIALADRKGWVLLSPDGVQRSRYNSDPEKDEDATAVTQDRNGTVLLALVDKIKVYGGKPAEFTPRVPRGSSLEAFEIQAMAVTWNGELLVADAKSRHIWRLTASGERPVVFDNNQPIDIVSMAVNDLDQVAAINRDAREVVVLDRLGNVITRVARPGERFAEPVSVTFDPLGHLYVLDKDRRAVDVFSPDFKRHLATFSPRRGTPGELGDPVALVVSADGSLFVLDNRDRRILVYR